VQQLTGTLIDVPAGARPWQGEWESAAQQLNGALSVQASVGTATPRRLAQTVNSDAHRRIKIAYSAIQSTATYRHTIGSLQLMRHYDRTQHVTSQTKAAQQELRVYWNAGSPRS
jgi:hypothetical protein